MKLLKLTLLILFTFPVLGQWQLSSPKDSLRISINLNAQGELHYEVDAASGTSWVPVIATSGLGVNRSDCDFRTGLSFVGVDSMQVTDEYELISGKSTQVISERKEMTLSMMKCNVNIDFIFSISDESFAYRYSFPDSSNTVYNIDTEKSEFKVAQVGGRAWLQNNTSQFPVYEGFFDETTVGNSSSNTAGWVFPLLLEVGPHWVFLTETDLDSNYYASHISSSVSNGIYKYVGPLQNDGIPFFDHKAYFSTPMKTPWRVAGIFENLDQLVRSNVSTDLAKPSVLNDESYISAGIATFSWWSHFASSSHVNFMKPYVDLAEDLACPYFMIDADWNLMNNVNSEIPAFVSYANNKNVKLWLWYNTGGPHNLNTYAGTTQPRDRMHIRATRRAEFAKIKNWGIVGVKIDFFMSDKQAMIKLYQEILEDAKEFELMVNFHGCTAPRGWQRTYPNLLTMEAVAGGEGVLFNPTYRQRVAQHNVNLVFTRNILGSMDYTPGIFAQSYFLNGDPIQHNTTASHQFALINLFETGMTHFADHYSRFQNLPNTAKEVIRNSPSSWDEVKLLEGFLGQDVLLVRRKGDNFFIMGINGENQTKSWNINTHFLPSGTYRAMKVMDGVTNEDFLTQELDITAGTSISMTALPYGGFTILLEATCLENLTILPPFQSSEVHTLQGSNVLLQNKLISPADFEVKAERHLLMEPPFEVEAGSVFHGSISPCE